MPISYLEDKVEIIDDESGLKITIDIIPTEKLKPHEEIIEEAIKKLIKDITDEGVVRNPIIIDENTLVILDGMHRYEACKRLGLKYIPVAAVDYNDPRVGLSTWIRLIKLKNISESEVESRIKLLDKELEPYKSNTPYTVTIYFKGKLIYNTSIHFDVQTKYNVYYVLKKLEKDPSLERLKITYQPDSIVKENMKFYLKSYDLVIVPPKLEKRDVIEIALQGKVYPPKSTRHTVPARPLNLNIPMKILMSSNEREVRREVMTIIRSLKVRKVRGEKVDTYRDYDETIYYFYS